MSHYFDDESALEELLNQQLNRAKRVSDTNATRKIQGPTRAASQSLASARSTTNDKQELSMGQDAVVSKPADSSTNRLSSWLDGPSKRVQSIQSDSGAVQSVALTDTARGLESSSQVGSLAIASDEESLEHILREERLQEMSKQRLIKLIMGQVIPALSSLKQTGGKELKTELERLRIDLKLANEALAEAQKYRDEQIQLAETKWSSLIRRLEDKLERCEQELETRRKLHRDSVEELEREHRMQVKDLEESYRLRLDEERLRCEATLKRRDEHYALEMRSKVKISCELERVDDLFGDVSRALQGNASDLELQLRLLKEALEKQKNTIIGSNKELTDKTERLCQHYGKFESQMSQISGSAQELAELLPKLIQVHEQSRLTDGEIMSHLNKLESRQEELNEQQAELARRRERLDEERVQCMIKEAGLAERQERLNEQLSTCEQSRRQVRERELRLEEGELMLRSQRAGLDQKSANMKRLNTELHLSRQKLERRAEELNKADLGLAEERQVVEGQWRRLRGEWSRLSGLGKQIHAELKQLSMLERTLVCSVCLERLVPGDGDLAVVSDNKWCLFNRQQSVVVNQLRQSRSQLRRPQRSGSARARRELERAARRLDEGHEDDSDGRQLEEETRYAELVVDAY